MQTGMLVALKSAFFFFYNFIKVIKTDTLDIREEIDRNVPVPVCRRFRSYSLSPLFSQFSLLTYEYLRVCGTRSGGRLGISSPFTKGMPTEVEHRGEKFEFFFSLTFKGFH